MKEIVILGASGSIGTQALDLIKDNLDLYKVTKISIGHNVEKLKEILNEFKTIQEVALLDESALVSLEEEYPTVTFYLQNNGIIQMLESNPTYDIVLNAIVGFAGLRPSITTIKLNKTLALANKETMVVGGEIINDLLIQHPQASILPVDSEHCAIFQCISNGKKEEVSRLLITASGGSFRDKTLEELKDVTVEQALNHPNWDMGASITIDSATMLNKGLEVIEAHYLFGIDYENIEVLIHRQSIVHSMVEFKDSSTIAQLSMPDMRQPIEFAFAYPLRNDFKESRIDFSTKLELTFDPVDYTRFKGLKLAFEAGKKANSYPCVLNAAKEVATTAFLKGYISFLDIVDYVEKALQVHKEVTNPTLEELIKVDSATRRYVVRLISEELNKWKS